MRGQRAVLAVAALAVLVLAFAFAHANRSQTIRLDFGIWSWSGEAVHALFAAAVVGLLAMFVLALPADLRAREERRRLADRARVLERQLAAERATRAAAPVERGEAPRDATAPEP